MKKIIIGSIFIILIAIIWFKFLYNKSIGLILSYSIYLNNKEPRKPLVQLEVLHSSKSSKNRFNSLILSAPMQDEYVGISEIKINNGEIKYEIKTKETKFQNWHLTKYNILYYGSGFTLTYRPTIGIREGNSHTGFSGLKFGYVDNNFGIASGYNLFLFPIEDGNKIKINEVYVKIINESEKTIYVPWIKRGNFYCPEIKASYKLESLLKSSIVWGDFDWRELTISNTNFEIIISKLIKKDIREDILNKTNIILSNIIKIFGEIPLKRISIYFLPKTKDGYDIYAPNWVNNFAISMYPPTNSRWKKFTSQFLNIYLLYKPFRKIIYKQEDYWLIDGLKYYFADKSLDWINRVNFKSLISNYENKLINNDKIILSNLFIKKINYLSEEENYKIKSTYILNKIDKIIIQESHGKYNLNSFLRYYFKNNRRNNFINLISKYLNTKKYEKELLGYITHTGIQSKVKFNRSYTINKNQKAKYKEINSDTTILKYDKKLKILHVARHKNFLENCGCKTNQNGGIARLATIIKKKRNQDKDLILLNLGDNIPIEKHEMKLKEFTKKEIWAGFHLLKELQFDAINVRFTELLYTPEYFLKLLSTIPLPYINSNIKLNGKTILPNYQILYKKGIKIGIFGLTTDRYFGKQKKIFEDNTYFLRYEKPVKIISSIVDRLRKQEKVDLVVMLCSFDQFELEKIIKNQDIDLILTSTLPSPYHFYKYGKTYFLNNTLVIHSDLGPYGLIESDIYLKNYKIVSANSKIIELDESIKDDVKIRRFLNEFYLSISQQINDFRKVHLWEEYLEKSKFVGIQNCKICHVQQYIQWKKTAHATAYATLLKRHRNYFPNCVQCHVTAFEFKPGFSIAKINDKTFQNVQCEMCHGPGSEHIKNPYSNSLLKTPTYSLCIQCHDQDHSDLRKSNFDKYYHKVIH